MRCNQDSLLVQEVESTALVWWHCLGFMVHVQAPSQLSWTSQAVQVSMSQGNKGSEPVCKGMKPVLAKGFRARALLLLLSL